MTADGTSLTRLTTSAADEPNPSWSPDGARIAFTQTTADEPFHLYTVNADGRGQQRARPRRRPAASPGFPQLGST
jgi:Tol biopolymer transport system component